MTKNFRLIEFQSKCGRGTPSEVIPNIQLLANQLQVLRDEVKVPIKINSGYRSPEHNAKIGGVKKSKHIFGQAADIVVQGHTPQQVYAIIERLISEGKMLEGGLKAYKTFIHYDIRGKKARW